MYAPLGNPEVAQAVREGNESLGRAFKAAFTGHPVEAVKHVIEGLKPSAPQTPKL